MADVLKTDYKDDVLDTAVNERRKYNIIENEDGTVSFEDVSTYVQTGDLFGAQDMNAITSSLANGMVRFSIVDGELYYSIYTEDVESEV